MKKLFLIITLILTTLFTSCTKVVYVDKDTNKIINQRNKSKSFINLRRVNDYSSYPHIYVDTYTDVLYVSYRHKMSAIMKVDGHCFTYTEWKERNK